LGTLNTILSELLPQALPAFEADAFDAHERYPYGARSEAAVYVGDLLAEEVPQLGQNEGTLGIVAIARRPGVLSKVAVRARAGVPVSTTRSIGADHLARVRQRLDGERIHVVAWQRSASAYIADALELGEIPPVVLLAGIGHARVLLGEIDVRGIAGWRGLNTVLASALTGWRIRLEPVAATAAWRRLHTAMLARRPLAATVVGHTERGPRVEVLGLYALLPRRTGLQPGQEVEVRITRMDPDEGRIFVSDRLVATGQLPLL
jgi:transcription antitermination factor NusA-like protein